MAWYHGIAIYENHISNFLEKLKAKGNFINFSKKSNEFGI
jgi:hypothetical protein